jgi:DsbC/DsbD-like thiol-disulfide interchange protein
MRHSWLSAAAFILATPALAASTGWQELAPDARVRLIASESKTAAGTTFVAIELDMPPDMKTYWRVPGESGIAAELDWAGSSGVAHSRFHWPYPTTEHKDGYTDFVYYGPLVIPVELTVESDAPQLEAALLMGICSDICVPAMAKFSLPLNLAQPDPGQDLRIQQALATAPIPWDREGEPVGDVGFDATAGELWVRVDPSIADPGSVLVDASGAGYLFGAPQKSREPGLVSLPLLGGGDTDGLVAGPVTVVFMTRDGAYEVERQVAASTLGTR